MLYNKSDIGDEIAANWGHRTEETLEEFIKRILKDPHNLDVSFSCLLASIAKQSIETNRLLRLLNKKLTPLETASKIALAAGEQRRKQIQVGGLEEL